MPEKSILVTNEDEISGNKRGNAPSHSKTGRNAVKAC